MAAGTVYSVGQINTYVARMFSEDYLLRQVMVRGEVSNCTYHSSGHIYFTLKDASGTLSCMMYAGKRSGGLSFHMKEGDGVVVSGSVRVFEKQGKYQLYAERIVRDGIGILNERFELLKKKLEEMGMFSEEYKQPLPRYIRRLGIVTAPTGAAVRDIIQIARRRNPYVEILLYPAVVQGEEAPGSLIRGIQAMDAAGVDVIIVGRGGGSIEDLWAFNEESVAEAVFQCRTPIISAVGHEVDTVITDYVADFRAPTPSAAAEIAVFDWNRFQADCLQLQLNLQKAMLRKLELLRQRSERLKSELVHRSPGSRLEMQRMAAEQLKAQLRHACLHRIEKTRSGQLLRQQLEERMTGCLERSRRELNVQERLRKAMEDRLLHRRHTLQLLASELEKDSPAARLSGGYGLVMDAAGRRVASAYSLHPEDAIQIRMKDGCVDAKVTGVTPEGVALRKKNGEEGNRGAEEIRK